MLEIITFDKNIGLDTTGPIDRPLPVPLSELEKTLKDSLRRLPPAVMDDSVSSLPTAAVCAIFKESTQVSGAELLLIKRNVSERDPWSGQMAFPGGRSRVGETPVDTVTREVLEETKIGLLQNELLGPLNPVIPGNASTRVFPFVSFKHEPVMAVIDGIEIAEYYWIPFSFFLDLKNSLSYEVTRNGVSFSVPAFVYEENIIWV